MHIAFAERYNWTPDMVDDLPVEYVDDIAVYWEAENKAEEVRRKRREAGSRK